MIAKTSQGSRAETIKQRLKPKWLRLRSLLIGRGMRSGLVARMIVMILLIDVALIYVYPILYMLSTMMMSTLDLVDPTIRWIPTELYWDNLAKAFEGLKYWHGLGQTVFIALIATAAQTLSCAVAGYGFARYKFPGKNLLFMLVFLTFIVPPQTIVIPLYLLYRNFGWLNTYYPLIVPEMLGLGLKGSLFIIIYRQFFLGQPQSLEEAARLDGANSLTIFARIMLPLAKPAVLVVSLFSFVWHWNDYYLPSMFISNQDMWSLVRRLQGLQQTLDEIYDVNPYGLSTMTEPVRMAGAFLVIVPILVLYFIAQRWFTESIERTGLVE
ncbi:MAG TPA: carbohydrate ABC transporter permease [Limnochordia bacterium]|nr:carbohydrate ABC transporter permease [Limnochordia bacterium]